MGRKEDAGYGWMSDREFDNYAAIEASKGNFVGGNRFTLFLLCIFVIYCFYRNHFC